MWNFETVWMNPEFETQEPYHHGNTVWKFDKTSIEPLGND